MERRRTRDHPSTRTASGWKSGDIGDCVREDGDDAMPAATPGSDRDRRGEPRHQRHGQRDKPRSNNDKVRHGGGGRRKDDGEEGDGPLRGSVSSSNSQRGRKKGQDYDSNATDEKFQSDYHDDDFSRNFDRSMSTTGSTVRNDARQPSWDDLQDAIGLAMRQSLAVDSHTRNYDDDDHDDGDDIDIVIDTDNDEDDRPWNCPACTYLNEDPLHLVCAICGTARLASKLLPSSSSIALSSKGELSSGPPPTDPHIQSRNQRPQSTAVPVPSGEIVPPKSSKPKKQHRRPTQPKRPQQSPPSCVMTAMDPIAEDPPSSSRQRKQSHPSTNLERSRDGSTSPPRDSDHIESGERPPRRKNHPHGSEYSASETSIASFGKLDGIDRRGSSNSQNSDERKGRRQRPPLERDHKAGKNSSYGSDHSDSDTSIASFGKLDATDRRGTLNSSNSQERKGHRHRPRNNSFNDSLNNPFNDSFDSRDKRMFVGKNKNSLRRSSIELSTGDFPDFYKKDKGPLRHSSVDLSSKKGKNSFRDDDDASRSSRRSNRSSRSIPIFDYRRVSFDSHPSNDHRDCRRKFKNSIRDADNKSRSDPSSMRFEEGVGSISSGLDSPDISGGEDSHYRDDKTARTMRTIKTLRIPEGEVTIIYTDVQGSTSLWEADPIAMKKATDLHDSIIRKCYADHGGYEITTEGDSFNLAFQHPADAIGFALRAQLSLYRANWPEGILNNPHGCFKEKKKFRGFRVRMGMHHGPTTSSVHETTGRTHYQGEAVDFAKAIEKMTHGGQILTTVETWRAVSGMAEQFLGSPQVMDCGEHLLFDMKKEKAESRKTKRVFSKRIVQLVPNSLSYDFFAARGGQETKEGETPPPVCGRVFPPLLSYGQLSTSFLNAPYISNRVAMVFVYTDKMESASDIERKKNYKILAKYVRSHLMRLSPPGYECQEDRGSWMLAFDRIENGIKFGLDLREDVSQNADISGNVDKERAFRIGIHWGPFLSMGPHTVSGHADYFGPIVNRAARVAAQCEPGQVCVGVPMGDGEEPPDPGPSVDVDVLGVKQLKGISVEMALFACRKKHSKAKSMLT